MKKTWIALFVLVFLLVSLSANPSQAACETTPPCCHAEAGTVNNPCDLQFDTCTCTSTCGPNVQSCSCQCNRGPRPTTANTAAKIFLNVGNVEVALTGNVPKLGDLLTWLQPAFNWWLQVPAEKYSRTVPTGIYHGSLADVLQRIANATETTLTINEGTGTIVFQ